MRQHLDATYKWLCAAHDATSDGGVAGWYNLVKGWSTSYPETTGYIIPSFLAYASTLKNAEAKERALQMADWEARVQLPTGALTSGVLGRGASPSVFNTGQALFGWTAAFQTAGKENYRQAVVRSAQWLVEQQDDDGAWRRNLSSLTTTKVQTYNTRSAWGLAVAGTVFGEPRWVEAARKNCNWALGEQMRSGWFSHNTFYEKEAPLLHTIGYVLEGFLGVGTTLGEERYIDAARSGIDPLVTVYRGQGALKGRYDQAWRNTVSWRCPTGEAQVALVLLRLCKQAGNGHEYHETAMGLIEDVARIQDIESPFRESKGAIAGSQPIWRGYCPLTFINWGAKFYLDALLLALLDRDVQDVAP